jgi:hypothetical protein
VLHAAKNKKPGPRISYDISATRLSSGDPIGFPPHPHGWLSIIVYLLPVFVDDFFQSSAVCERVQISWFLFHFVELSIAATAAFGMPFVFGLLLAKGIV